MKTAKLFDAVSAASDRNSVWYDLSNERGYSIAVQFTGTDVIGTLSLDAAVGDDDPNIVSPVYAQITNSSTSITASSDVVYAVSDAEYRWVRIVWDYTSGTGNMTAIVQVKTPQRA